MNCNYTKVPFLVERQSGKIVIGSYTPKSEAPVLPTFLHHGSDKCRPDSFSLTNAVKRDQLTSGIRDYIRPQTNWFPPFILGNKTME